MLFAKPTTRMAGLCFWGDAWDLDRIHDFIHRICDESNPYLRDDDDYTLALAYDIRKAKEGQRSKKELKYFEDKKTVYGVEVLWVHAAVQIGLLRKAMAFSSPMTARDQATMYELEAAFEDAVRAGFGPNAEGVINEARRVADSNLPAKMSRLAISRGNYFACLTSAKDRRASLAGLLFSFGHSYDLIYKAQQRSGTSTGLVAPEELARFENLEPVDFKW